MEPPSSTPQPLDPLTLKPPELLTVKRAHHKLEAWKHAMQLVKTVYTTTSGFPDSELYGLTSQMRRAAVSVPSNIAEGAARETTAEFLRFLYIARGSLAELETQLLIAKDLGFSKDTEGLMAEIFQVSALLDGLIRSLRARSQRVKEDEPSYDEQSMTAEV